MSQNHDHTLTLYIGGRCPLCEEASMVLNMISQELGWPVNVIDIYQDPELLERYQLMIPVITLNDDLIQYGRIYYGTFMEALSEKGYLVF